MSANCRSAKIALKWSPWCLGSRPTRSCLASSTKKLGAMARRGTVSKSQCCRCSVPIHRASASTHAKQPQLQNGMRTSMSMCAFWPETLWHNLVESPRIASAEFGESSKICVPPRNAAQSSWRRSMWFQIAGTHSGPTLVYSCFSNLIGAPLQHLPNNPESWLCTLPGFAWLTFVSIRINLRSTHFAALGRVNWQTEKRPTITNRMAHFLYCSFWTLDPGHKVLKGVCKKGKSLIHRTHISGTQATGCEQLYNLGRWLWHLSKVSRIGAHWCATSSTGRQREAMLNRTDYPTILQAEIAENIGKL